jgi:hypothetical protein
MQQSRYAAKQVCSKAGMQQSRYAAKQVCSKAGMQQSKKRAPKGPILFYHCAGEVHKIKCR